MSFSPEEWKNRSIKGEVCAVVMCSNLPKNQCPTCFLRYCYEHVKNHGHRVADEELKKQKEEFESLK